MTFEPDDYSVDIHEPDATGFPDGEGESADVLQDLVYPPTARDRANEWDEAIREAAKVAAEDLAGMGLPSEDELADKTYQAIIYKLEWVAKTGQGTRDIV